MAIQEAILFVDSWFEGILSDNGAPKIDYMYYTGVDYCVSFSNEFVAVTKLD